METSSQDLTAKTPANALRRLPSPEGIMRHAGEMEAAAALPRQVQSSTVQP